MIKNLTDGKCKAEAYSVFIQSPEQELKDERDFLIRKEKQNREQNITKQKRNIVRLPLILPLSALP